MKITIKFLFFLILILGGCNNSQKPISTNKITIDFEDSQYLNTSEVFNDFRIIQLETTKESIIGEITKIRLTDSYIFILDYRQKKLFRFNKNGKFLNTIHNVGDGPNEYRSLNDFDHYQNKLYLLSRDSRKLFVYNEKLELEETIKLQGFYHKLTVLNNQYLAIYTNFRSNKKFKLKNILIFNIQNKTIEKGVMDFQQSQHLRNSRTHDPFFRSNDSMFITIPFHFDVYHLSAKGINPYLNIDLGRDKVYPEQAKDFNHDERIRYEKNNNYNMINKPIAEIESFYIIKNNYLFSFINKGLLYQAFYNRNTKQYKLGYLVSDETIPLSLNSVNCSFKSNLISYMNPSSFSYKFYQKPAVKKKLKEKGLDIDNINQNNNPFIIKFKLK